MKTIRTLWFGMFLLLMASPGYAATFTLTWQDNANNEDGFMIERGSVVAGPFSQINVVGPGILTYVDAGLLDGVSFCYRVRAFNSVGNSAYTNIACGTIPLAAPTLTGVVFTSGQGVKITWVRASSNETGYEVERANVAAGPFIKITTTAASATTYTDAACVVPNTTCFYRVRAINAAMASVYSNVMSITVPQTLPNAPSSLTIAKAGNGKGTVTSNPAGINCGSDCSQAYAGGTAVTLTAQASNFWYRFSDWTGASGCTTSRTCVVTLVADQTVTARFTRR